MTPIIGHLQTKIQHKNLFIIIISCRWQWVRRDKDKPRFFRLKLCKCFFNDLHGLQIYQPNLRIFLQLFGTSKEKLLLFWLVNFGEKNIEKKIQNKKERKTYAYDVISQFNFNNLFHVYCLHLNLLYSFRKRVSY